MAMQTVQTTLHWPTQIQKWSNILIVYLIAVILYKW